MVKDNKTIKKTEKKFENRPDSGKTVKVKDMLDWYRNTRVSSRDLNKVVYKTYVKEFFPMNVSITEILPGSVNKEFFMTKGHIHKSGKEEIYVLLEGKGKLLLQKNNKARVVELIKEGIALINKGEAHRLVNVGNKILKVMTIYHSKSNPSYDVKFKKRFFKK